MPENNHFFVDGSCLLSDISSIKSAPEFASKKLDIIKFSTLFVGRLTERLHGGTYIRFVVYFVEHENRICDNIILPTFEEPGQVEDFQIKYCGKRVSGSLAVDRWISEHNPPPKVLEKLQKSEKAVDTQICCDALQLVSCGKLDRLFIYTNDFDFIPLCRTLKSLGSNISLFKLQKRRINKALVKECDSFTVAPEEQVNSIFV